VIRGRVSYVYPNFTSQFYSNNITVSRRQQVVAIHIISQSFTITDTKMPASAKSTLRQLYRANLGIIRQKLGLLEGMKQQFGTDKAKDLFCRPCPIVKASIGQHIRHSMDHMELVAKAAGNATQKTTPESPELHYDLRLRGGTDETDLVEAEKRILNVQSMLLQLDQLKDPVQEAGEPSSSTTHQQNTEDPTAVDIDAFFMLSGDPEEFKLPSTISRELGFAAHHGIHHLAMIKIIALESLQLDPDLLPSDFGRAPSTIVHDSEQL
jgi:hypothetical protein